MEYVRLGGTGLQVSRLCLGMMSYGDPGWRPWILDAAAAAPFVRKAAAEGITFFDTADVYSLGVSEEVTGRLLRETFARREEYVLATKVCMPVGDGPNDAGLSRAHIMDACDASLRRLGVDHIDLYQVHRWDPETPIEETMQALHDLVRAGKVRYLGASSMWAWQFAKAQHAADIGGWTRFVSMQNHYNLLFREEEREMIPQLLDQRIASIPWSPLARGWLARAARSGDSPPTTRAGSDELAQQRYADISVEVLEAVAAVAVEHDVPPAQVAIAWLLHQPVVTAPIIGATRLEHLDAPLAAIDLELSDGDLHRLESPYRPMTVMDHR